ncbi:Gfo/Idh/MocA family protein [Psychromicrobium lacuslunae]|uniref:Dehydrogenase n=1 Tax=Psychromicrobium lacuslunae TaxID=1618207 RepID=A0A0D4C2A9_9MICC|nr:Gfo/Idh/MocA family oxidoreductase [Psychromicrobium lacuslunae]AJT42679.1 dehydrogenase [Psychromicrobium lacuslunae]
MRLGLVGVGRIGMMHARNLLALQPQPELLLADARPGTAEQAAGELAAGSPRTVDQLLQSRPDAIVIAAATPAHRPLVERAVLADIPVFCEKPVAPTTEEALALSSFISDHEGVVQIGHQRRFDPGYLRARSAFNSGELGWLHSLRAITADARPPAIEFLASSGGLFRDCSVHDFDIIRWITGREIVQVYAQGSNKGDPAIAEVGDVDTAAALLTLDDGTLATVLASRYNGAGHDVRLELQGSEGSLMVGLDSHSAFRSAEPAGDFPRGTAHSNFAERFAEAYRAQLDAFMALVRGEIENPCTAHDSAAASAIADAAQASLESGEAVRLPAPGK